jgi:Mg/Co/Ni transporter MgtE
MAVQKFELPTKVNKFYCRFLNLPEMINLLKEKNAEVIIEDSTYKGDFLTALAISISLIVVVIVAGLIGTFIPLFLDKRGIDPAIATGPFITTSNDIFGILIYFWIAKMVLGI